MAEQTKAGGQGGVAWDTASMRRHGCDLANATAVGEAVLVNFGARSPGALAPGEAKAALLQCIALRPLTARHLQDMLGKLLAEADAQANRPG